MNGNPSIWDDIKRQFSMGSILMRLIMFTTGTYLLQVIIGLIYFFSQGPGGHYTTDNFLDIFYAPYDWNLLIRRPWTVLTYMLFHYDVMHILFNMLFLYWFGRILIGYIGERKLLPIYVMGGIFGVLFSILVVNLTPNLGGSVILGASAGVLAVVAASGTLVPNHIVHLILIGPVRLQYVVIVLILLDLIAIPTAGNTGGRLAHLGGALFGFVFIKRLQAGSDWSIWFNRLLDAIASFFTPRSRGPRVVYRSERKVPVGGRRVRRKHATGESQEEVDRILDKISRSGYDSLSKEEKEILFRASQK